MLDHLSGRHTVRGEVYRTQCGLLYLFVGTPDLFAVAPQDVELLADLIGARKGEEVAGVGVPGNQPQRFSLAHAADHYRRVRMREGPRAVQRLL